MAKKTSAKAPSKSEVYASISEATGVSKKDVGAVLDALSSEIGKALSKKGSGAFQIPGLCKIIRVNKPAQPAGHPRTAKRPIAALLGGVPRKR